MYEYIYANTIGASHLQRELPCQDYGLLAEKDGCRVLAVSDGHGDPNCLRSDRGAKLICETAAEILPVFISSVKEAGKTEALAQLDKNLLKQLSASLIGNWLVRLEADVESEPITEGEIALQEARMNATVKYGPDYLRNEKTEKAYGCTLMAGILTEDFLFLLHQGDGRCVLVDAAGKVSQPIPWDDRCVGNMTTSCCDSDAKDSIRYAYIDLKQNRPLACFLSSDGVEDSFGSMEAMYAFFLEEIIFALDNGIKEAEADLAEYIPTMSKEGSRDDITVCGMIDTEACAPFREQFERYVKSAQLRTELKAVEENIWSIMNGGLYNHLKKRRDAAAARCAGLQTEAEELSRRLEQVKHDMELFLTPEEEAAAPTDLRAKVEAALQRLKKIAANAFQSDSMRPLAEEITAVLNRIEQMKPELEEAEKALADAEEEFRPICEEYESSCKTKESLERQIALLETQE